ncbi:MAG TPA: hypothetical protein VGB70_10580 [Allosphingosinicella sp.]|jgi:hypothetical protein
MKHIIALAALGLAAGCAASTDDRAELRADTDVRLAAELSNYRQSGNTRSCVPLRNLGGNRSVGEGAVVFGSGSRIWVNRPRDGCPLLRDDRTLILRTTSSQICSGDIVSVVDAQSGIHYGSCALGDFTPLERRRS